jgi:hypothetical protein
MLVTVAQKMKLLGKEAKFFEKSLKSYSQLRRSYTLNFLETNNLYAFVKTYFVADVPRKKYLRSQLRKIYSTLLPPTVAMLSMRISKRNCLQKV